MLKFRPNAPGKPPGPREDLGASLVHGGSISLLDCLFRHHSRLHSRLQGSLNLTLHKSQVSVHQGSPLMHESFPESSVRTGRVFGPVGQVFMHQGASLEHLRSLRPRAEQTLKGRAPLGAMLSPIITTDNGEKYSNRLIRSCQTSPQILRSNNITLPLSIALNFP